MINYEFIALQKKADLTNYEMSVIADCDRRVIEAYRKGESKIPKQVTSKINYYIAHLNKEVCNG